MADCQAQWKYTGTGATLVPRFDFTLVKVITVGGDKIVAIGGHGEIPSGFELQIYDSAASLWKPFHVKSDPAALLSKLKRGSHGAASVGGAIYIFCGFSDDSNLGDVLVLDYDEGLLRQPTFGGEPPSPRSSLTATAVGSRIYLFGGYGEEKSYQDVYILDTKAEKWIKPRVLGKPPSGRSSHSADALGTERILIFGGYSQEPLNDIWFLEVDTPFVKQKREVFSEEVVAWSQGILRELPKPVVICGPSGVGKGTLINKLTAEFPQLCGFSVSHTTRKPREGEVDGVHYHFTTREWMEEEIKAGGFLESADVHGNLYGTSLASVQEVASAGKLCILDIDVQGASQVKKSQLKATFVFISPPSFEELEKRLRGRGTETDAQVEKRLKNARAELERSKDSDLFDFNLVNDNLESCYLELKKILGLDKPSTLTKASESFEGPSKRSGHASSIIGSKLIIHGGSGLSGSSLSDISVLQTKGLSGGAPSVTTGLKWQKVEELEPSWTSGFWTFFGYDPEGLEPKSRYNHQAVSLNGAEILVAGGYDGKEEKPLGDCAVLNIT